MWLVQDEGKVELRPQSKRVREGAGGEGQIIEDLVGLVESFILSEDFELKSDLN